MSEVTSSRPGEYAHDLVEPPSTDEPAPPQPFLCAISADLFIRAWQGRSTEKERPHLHGVYVEPCAQGGATLTATNGRILITIRDPNAYVKGASIVTINDLMQRACKTRKSDMAETERVLLIRSDGVALPEAIVAHVFAADPDQSRDNAMDLFSNPDDMVCAVQYGDLLVNADFPKWRGIIPRYSEPGPSGSCFDAQLTRPLIAALTAYGGKMTPLSWFSYDRDPTKAPQLVKPFPFRLQHHDMAFEGFAIVMPLHSEDKGDLPDWVRA